MSVGDGKRFVAIGQTHGIGMNELRGVDVELASIGRRVDSHATFTCINKRQASMSKVREESSKNQWVHLACHGILDQKEPFRSAFVLYDGNFTIGSIIRLDLKNPEFAYLSTAKTVVGHHERLDEAIHLASVMQFAGFRSVIGTMWNVDDDMANKITSVFYRHMVDKSGCLDYTRAAFALNRTMIEATNVPLEQRILYVHHGA